MGLPDDKKGVAAGYNDIPRNNRKLNGFIFQDDIMEGSYGYHSYLLNGTYKMIEEGCFMNGLLSNIGTQQNGAYKYKATGEFKDAQLNGEGLKVYDKDGRIEFGTWEKGKLVKEKTITAEEKETFIRKCEEIIN